MATSFAYLNPARVLVTDDALHVTMASVPAPAAATTITYGQNADVDASPEQLTASSISSREVLVQADPANTSTVAVGDVSAQYFKLRAGESIALPVSNANLIYVLGGAANQVVNWIAVL